MRYKRHDHIIMYCEPEQQQAFYYYVTLASRPVVGRPTWLINNGNKQWERLKGFFLYIYIWYMRVWWYIYIYVYYCKHCYYCDRCDWIIISAGSIICSLVGRYAAQLQYICAYTPTRMAYYGSRLLRIQVGR